MVERLNEGQSAPVFGENGLSMLLDKLNRAYYKGAIPMHSGVQISDNELDMILDSPDFPRYKDDILEVLNLIRSLSKDTARQLETIIKILDNGYTYTESNLHDDFDDEDDIEYESIRLKRESANRRRPTSKKTNEKLSESGSINKSKWTTIFRDFADTVEISVDYDPKTREYYIVDDQGTISFDETFKNPTEAVERLYGLAERYILEDLDDEAESYGLTDFDEFPSNLNSMSDWYGLYADFDVDYDNPDFVEAMKDFIADHKSEFDWIDLFNNHCDAVDLKNLYK